MFIDKIHSLEQLSILLCLFYEHMKKLGIDYIYFTVSSTHLTFIVNDATLFTTEEYYRRKYTILKKKNYNFKNRSNLFYNYQEPYYLFSIYNLQNFFFASSIYVKRIYSPASLEYALVYPGSAHGPVVEQGSL